MMSYPPPEQGYHALRSHSNGCENVVLPPRPTETKDNRIRCGQRKSCTVEEINYDIEFQAKRDRENLKRIVE